MDDLLDVLRNLRYELEGSGGNIILSSRGFEKERREAPEKDGRKCESHSSVAMG